MSLVDQRINTISNKITIKRLIEKGKLNTTDVCSFFGIDHFTFESIFGKPSSTIAQIKPDDIPHMIVENMLNLIAIANNTENDKMEKDKMEKDKMEKDKMEKDKMKKDKKRSRGGKGKKKYSDKDGTDNNNDSVAKSDISSWWKNTNSDYFIAEKKAIYDTCNRNLKVLFTQYSINNFWSFINFITHSGDHLMTETKCILSEVNLIGIAIKYKREEIDLFERIWWFITNTFAKLLDGPQAIKHDPDWIASIIFGGEKHYNFNVNLILTNQWTPAHQPPKTTGFQKIFFKFDPNRVPAMFWNTTLFPVVFNK